MGLLTTHNLLKASVISVGFILAVVIFLSSMTANNALAADNSGRISDWKYGQWIQVNENANQDLLAYQVPVEFNETNFPIGADANGSDIRFGDDAGHLYPYWIEKWENGIYARIWVQLPYIPSGGHTKFMMYYGNPSAGSLSDGYSVFDWFDDFDADHNTYTKSGNMELKPNDSVLHYMPSTMSNPNDPGIALKLSRKNFILGARFSSDDWFYFNYRCGSDGWWAAQANPTSTVNDRPVFYKAVLADTNYIIDSDNKSMSGSQFYNVLIKAYDNYHEQIWPDLGIDWTYSDSFRNQTGVITINGDSGTDGYLDYVFIAKYVRPEPTIALMGVQQISADRTGTFINPGTTQKPADVNGSPTAQPSPSNPSQSTLLVLGAIVVILAVVVVVAGVLWRRRRGEKARALKYLAEDEPLAPGTQSAPGKQRRVIGQEVFISYSHTDKQIADAICASLEEGGTKCWIAPRDVLAGTNFQEAIIDAIDNSKIMVLIYSSHSNNSPHVIRELTHAVAKNVIIVPFRIEDTPPSKSMEYLISVPHWMDAMTPPLEEHVDDLDKTIRTLLRKDNSNPAEG